MLADLIIESTTALIVDIFPVRSNIMHGGILPGILPINIFDHYPVFHMDENKYLDEVTTIRIEPSWNCCGLDNDRVCFKYDGINAWNQRHVHDSQCRLGTRATFAIVVALAMPTAPDSFPHWRSMWWSIPKNNEILGTTCEFTPC